MDSMSHSYAKIQAITVYNSSVAQTLVSNKIQLNIPQPLLIIQLIQHHMYKIGS